MSYNAIPLGNKAPEVINAVIEIPKGSTNKYELDEKIDAIVLDRVMHSPMFYPVDYGFIPETRSGDGDHLDVMVVTNSPVFPGCVVPVRPLGLLRMTDDKGVDNKILAVPLGNPYFVSVTDISQLDPHILKEIVHFFEQYKALENKSVVLDGWGTKEEALVMIMDDHKSFKNES